MIIKHSIDSHSFQSTCISIKREYKELSIYLIILNITISDIACIESGMDGYELLWVHENANLVLFVWTGDINKPILWIIESCSAQFIYNKGNNKWFPLRTVSLSMASDLTRVPTARRCFPWCRRAVLTPAPLPGNQILQRSFSIYSLCWCLNWICNYMPFIAYTRVVILTNCDE